MKNYQIDLTSLEDRIFFDVAPLDAHAQDHGAVELNQLDGNAAEYDWAESSIDFTELLEVSENSESWETLTESTLDELGYLVEEELEASLPFDAVIENKELIVVDRSVDDFLSLVEQAIGNQPPNQYEILLVDSHESGIARINDRFSTTQYSAVHFVAHGNDGEIRIGAETWNSQFLAANQDKFSSWQNSLSSDADLIVYGCNVAESDLGQSFVEQLAMATGADVAASSDLTGAEGQGGDWDLEVEIGKIEADQLFVSGLDWEFLLDTSLVEISTGNDLTTEGFNGNTSHDSVAMDQNGNFVVTWTEDKAVHKNDIFAQRFDRDGNALGAAFLVNESTNGDQEHASVSMDDAGNFVIAWTDTDDDAIYAKTYFADGSVNTGEFVVDGLHATGALAAMDGAGNFAIAWEHTTHDEDKIHAKIYNADGSIRVGEFDVASGGSDRQNISIDMNTHGDFVVAWDKSEFSDDIYIRKYDLDGIDLLGGEQKVGDIIFTPFTNPDVSINDSGLVAVSMTVGFGQDIAVQIVNPDGSLGSSYFSINETSTGVQTNSTVSLNNGGDFVVAWQGEGIGDSNGIFRRIYDSGTDSFDNETRINTFTNDEQEFASVVMHDANDLVVVYSGQGSAGDTVFINRTTPPPANATDDSYMVDEDSSVSGNLISDDTGQGADSGTGPLTMNTTPVNDANNGTVTLLADGSFTYEPDDDFEGTDSFEYEISDSNGTATATVTINVTPVNDAPTDLDFDNLTIDENSPNNFIVGTASVTDVDAGESFDFTLKNDADGRFAINEDGELLVADQTRLNFEDNTSHNIEVEVEDSGGEIFSKVFTIQLNDINEAPTTVSDTFNVDEDTDLVITTADLIGNDSDPEGDSFSLDFSGFSEPTHGELIDNGDGTFTYVPDENFDGTDSFQYVVKDSNNLASTGNATIHLNPINDTPVAQGETVFVLNSGPTVIQGEQVLANDVDPDGDSLSIIIVRQPKNGVVQIVDGKLVYTPDPGFEGTDRVKYRVNDGTETSNKVTLKIKVTLPPPPVTESSGEDSPEIEPPADEPVNEDQPESENDINLLGIGSVNQDDSDEQELGHGLLPGAKEEGTFRLTTLDIEEDLELYKFSSSAAQEASLRQADIEMTVRYRPSIEKPFSPSTSEMAADVYAKQIKSDGFIQEIDHVDPYIKIAGTVDQVTFATLSSITSVLTVGYVLWMVRGGMLMASFVSSIPAWQSVDPLNIVEFGSFGSVDVDDESLESIVNQFSTGE